MSRTETISLLRHMKAAGFTAYKVDDLGDDDSVTESESITEVADAACAVDECNIWFRSASTKVARVFLVYGNRPGELVNDWAHFKVCDILTRDRFDDELSHWSQKYEASHG